MELKVICPACGSDAIYRYGKNLRKQQRYLCLNCDRQFTAWSHSPQQEKKPICPLCGKPMHIYRKQETCVRYRCSNYPECKTYMKILKQNNRMKMMDHVCKWCRYWDQKFSSAPGVFGCCLCPEIDTGIPGPMRQRNYYLFETVRFYSCQNWEPALVNCAKTARREILPTDKT